MRGQNNIHATHSSSLSYNIFMLRRPSKGYVESACSFILALLAGLDGVVDGLVVLAGDLGLEVEVDELQSVTVHRTMRITEGCGVIATDGELISRS